jgi:hypothetical protein
MLESPISEYKVVLSLSLFWAKERPAKDAARPREMKVFISGKKVNAMNIKMSECD